MAKVTTFINKNRIADLSPVFIDPPPNSLNVLGNPVHSPENNRKLGSRDIASRVRWFILHFYRHLNSSSLIKHCEVS